MNAGTSLSFSKSRQTDEPFRSRQIPTASTLLLVRLADYINNSGLTSLGPSSVWSATQCGG